MSSQSQIDANRRNAQLSTGPVTPQGKAAVSHNAFKHGLRSERYLDPEEDPIEFHHLCARLVDQFQPQTETEEHYVERMAISYHKLCFLEAMEEDKSNDYSDNALRAIWNRQTSLERTYDRARTQLRQIQAERKAEVAKDTRQAEVKQEARKLVTEALTQVTQMRQLEEHVAKLTAAPPEPIVAPPSS